MGEVYRALDTELDRTVAIKILPEALAGDQQRLQRFIQEAKAASALNHPHILTIYEIGTIGASRFIATEFIDGDTLRQRINAGLKLAEILEIAIQAGSALAAAHAAGIIHRDVKPENIMVRRDGYIKVLDFGLAKLTEPKGSTTDTEAPTRAMVNTGAGTVMGTANYMSPEQAKGISVDVRTDLWSLGAVLYEMVTGRVPFAGETPTETISLILQKEPPPLTRFAHDVPAELERIITKALTKDPEERYQTTKDMLIDLRNLKRKLEVDAEIDRTMPPEFRGAASRESISSGQTVPATVSGSSAATAQASAPHSASSAEYLVSGIKQHKLAIAVVAGLALIAVAAGIIGISAYLHARSTEVAIESIAVLPFVNQNHDTDSEYLSDGVTESIINSLTQLPNLKVIPSSSAFRYKGKDTDPLTAGKELGVRAILTGRIMQRGDNVTISVALIDVRDNKQLWGEQYGEKVSQLLSVQREIAQQITSNLRLKLSGEQQTKVSKHYTDNPEAYQLYLKGRFYWNKRSGEALKTSIEYYNQAIEKDPNYALAYAGLSESYGLLPSYSAVLPQDSFPQAKAAAQKALSIDDTLAEAHVGLANVLTSYDWNLAGAERELRRAIELNPNYATAHQWLSDGPLIATGRFDEAIAEMIRAQELDPLSLIINAEVGLMYRYARQPDKAIEQLRKTIEMDQSFYFAHWSLGRAYVMKGAFSEALSEYQIARRLVDDPYILGMMGHAYAVSGRRDEALKTIDQLKEISKRQYVKANAFAEIYAGLGDKDQAFQWLEKSYEQRTPDLIFIAIDPIFDNLRSDPRFADLVRRVGLPQ
jgi:serine/threonine protein kinase/Flp pilus assembly protein TadD